MELTQQTAIAHGSFEPEENAHIFNKWFERPLSHFVRYVLREYDLGKRSVADIGSAYGHVLSHFGPGSYGVELNPDAATWSNAIGLTVYSGDMETLDLPPVSAVWCQDTLEHVDSPHLFLRSIARTLEDDGLAFLSLPLTNAGRHLGRFWQRFRGYTAEDHVNFFTATTLRWTIERAGFEIVEMTTGMGRLADRLCMSITPQILVVARKIPGWEYHHKSTRETVDGRPGRKAMPLHQIGYT